MKGKNSISSLRKNASLKSVAEATRRQADAAWDEFRHHDAQLRLGSDFAYRCRVNDMLATAVRFSDLADHLERLAGLGTLLIDTLA